MFSLKFIVNLTRKLSFTNTPTATQRNKIGADRIQLEALVVLLSIMMLASQFALSAFNAPSMGVAPALGAQRAEALTMFGGGKKAAPKKAAGRRLQKSAANSKAAVSATGRSSTFIDVTGRPYVEVDTFVPKYDEIGVLPPLGRWDPLQIREQVRGHPGTARPRARRGAPDTARRVGVARGGGASLARDPPLPRHAHLAAR